MCRIFGHIGSPIDTETLSKVSKAMLNGGPDHQKFINTEIYSIGSNILSINDKSKTTQPNFSSNREIISVLNGEIYNYKELSQKFLSNIQLKTNSDSEIIPHLYEIFGHKFINLLDGMFSIAIIDLRKEIKFSIYTDHLGMKPIFYSYNDKSLFFASELRGLKEFNIDHGDIGTVEIEEYFRFRSIQKSKTLFSKIKKMLPGEIIELKINGELKKIDSYFETSNQIEGLHSLLQNEISRINNSTHKIGYFLSGGLDSSLICSMSSRSNQINTFTVNYENYAQDLDFKYSNLLVNKIKSNNHSVNINSNSILNNIDQLSNCLSEPNPAPHAFTTFMILKRMKTESIKISVTGDGADELFCGYERFGSIFNQKKNFFNSYINSLGVSNRYTLNNVLNKDFIESNFSHKINKIDKLQFLLNFERKNRFPSYILHRIDNISSEFGIENRLPFCQKAILNFSKERIGLKDVMTPKLNLKNISNKYLPKRIIYRTKSPFYMPFCYWSYKSKKLLKFTSDIVLNGYLIKNQIINEGVVAKIIKEQSIVPSEDHSNILWSILIFEKWLNHHQPN